jgi:tetratricopeptide (TPR) repeat protein
MNWIKSILIAINFFIVLSTAYSQQDEMNRKFKNDLNKVASLIEQRNYRQSIHTARQLLVQHPNSSDVMLLLGLGYINLGNKGDSAIYFLKKGWENLSREQKNSETGINLQLSLGKAYQQVLQPEQAIKTYNKLLPAIPDTSLQLLNEIMREIEVSQSASLLIKNPIALKITNLGKTVNTQFDDHTPLVTATGKQMIFTSRRNQPDSQLLDDGQYVEKVCVATYKDGTWQDTRLLQDFFKKKEHESALSLSADGKTMFLFKNDPDGKNLYSATIKGKSWSQPIKLPEPINSYSHETHCSLSADGSTLFFTSDRPGGFGGLDIFMCKKLPDGTWGNARNLGPAINTHYDEEAPMVYLDGKTLYFSSEGHNSMGLFDIFYSTMNPDSTWSEPVNLGFPINTPGDDFFFVPTIQRNQAYYASTRFPDNFGGLDIYLVEFEKEFEGKLAVIEGKVETNQGYKTIRVLVTRTNDDVLVGDYRPDSSTGEYLMFLETGFRYQIKEVRQKIEEVVLGEVEISEDLSFTTKKEAVRMKSISMEPPLTPEERLARQQLMEKEKKGSTPTQIIPPTEYTIQILALRRKRIKDFSFFQGLDHKQIKEYRCKDGLYRYTYQTFNGLTPSLEERAQIVTSTAFIDAFVRPVQQLEDLKVKSILKK